VLLRQLDDLATVAGGAHARLHLAEAIQDLFEAGFGQVHGEVRYGVEKGGML
jgi:hypothetical protein